MPELHQVNYSREETVQAVRDYYSFLTRMYLDESRVLEPPSGGWPHITPERFQPMEKTDDVIDLLRHLPYIVSDDYPDHPDAAAACKFADYRKAGHGTVEEARWSTEDLKYCTEGGYYSDTVPSTVVGLTNGGRYNPIMLLDVELGIVHWLESPDDIPFRHFADGRVDEPSELDSNCSEVVNFAQSIKELQDRLESGYEDSEQDSVSADDDNSVEGGQPDEDTQEDPGDAGDNKSDRNGQPDEASSEEEELEPREPGIIEGIIFDSEEWEPETERVWRIEISASWPIVDFFEILKFEFRKLNAIPLNEKVVLDIRANTDEEGARLRTDLQRIWGEHGWPEAESNGTFDKVKCLGHIREFLKENYPDRYTQYMP